MPFWKINSGHNEGGNSQNTFLPYIIIFYIKYVGNQKSTNEDETRELVNPERFLYISLVNYCVLNNLCVNIYKGDFISYAYGEDCKCCNERQFLALFIYIDYFSYMAFWRFCCN